MVIRNTLGYVLGGLGVVGIAAWSIPQFKTAIPQLSLINDTVLIAVSGILVVAGLFFIVKGGSRKVKEVPIYQGKNIVGYRRH